jgi:hypothetical protein
MEVFTATVTGRCHTFDEARLLQNWKVMSQKILSQFRATRPISMATDPT